MEVKRYMMHITAKTDNPEIEKPSVAFALVRGLNSRRILSEQLLIEELPAMDRRQYAIQLRALSAVPWISKDQISAAICVDLKLKGIDAQVLIEELEETGVMAACGGVRGEANG